MVCLIFVVVSLYRKRGPETVFFVAFLQALFNYFCPSSLQTVKTELSYSDVRYDNPGDAMSFVSLTFSLCFSFSPICSPLLHFSFFASLVIIFLPKSFL